MKPEIVAKRYSKRIEFDQYQIKQIISVLFYFNVQYDAEIHARGKLRDNLDLFHLRLSWVMPD